MQASHSPSVKPAFDEPLLEHRGRQPATASLNHTMSKNPSETEQSAIQAQYWLGLTATCFGVLLATIIIIGLIIDMQ